MQIDNLEQTLNQMGFIKVTEGFERNSAGYYLKVNENVQIFIVSTDVRGNDVMFISEHLIKTPNNKVYEDDYENYKIHSEYVTRDGFDYVIQKYNLDIL